MNSPNPHELNRILMTADTIGGVWTYALDLCRGLLAHEVEVILATMGAPLQPSQRVELTALGPGVRLCESSFKLEWMDDAWADVAEAGEWLLDLERRYRPDLIHLNGYVHASLAWSAPVLVVAHSCVYSWWHAVKDCAPPPSWEPYHRAVQAGIQQADCVVAPSAAMLSMITRHYGAPRHPRVIGNGRPVPTMTRAGKQPYILCVGRLWDEAKNMAALASVAPDLPWPVRAAGATRGIDGAVTELPNLQLLGTRAPGDLQRDYRGASIFAHPARYEPFGLSVLEAALAGCALVLGDIPSLRETWEDAATFVDPGEPRALRSALLNLIEHAEQRQERARQAFRRARGFTVRRMTTAYVSAYVDLITRRASAPRISAPSLV